MPNPEWENYELDREKALRLVRLLLWLEAHPELTSVQSFSTTLGHISLELAARLTLRYRFTPEELQA